MAFLDSMWVHVDDRGWHNGRKEGDWRMKPVPFFRGRIRLDTLDYSAYFGAHW
jgi:hypothetical protein